jgi:hypothetical protein
VPLRQLHERTRLAASREPRRGTFPNTGAIERPVVAQYSLAVAASFTWSEETSLLVEAGEVAEAVADANLALRGRPVIATLRAEGAEITMVIGDESGTSLVYFPPDYSESGVGSLISIGDPDAAKADLWQPPLVAYYFGHHTELPRWSVVPHEAGTHALEEFCDNPRQAPTTITWQSG